MKLRLPRKRGRIRVAPPPERTVDGIVFASKLEARVYRIIRGNPDVAWFIRQPAFDLPGGTKYRADFLVVWKTGRVSVVDAKGHRTAEFIRNKRQVEALYPVEIEEWR